MKKTTTSFKSPSRWLTRAIQHPLWWLGVAGFLSLAIYIFIFTRTAFLFDLIGAPKFDLRLMVQAEPSLLWLYRAGFLMLALTYSLGAWSASRVKGWRAWTILAVTIVLSIMALMLVYPFDAADIFDYIIHGRMLALYGANPYQQTPFEFSQDPIFPYVGWTKSTSPYGPIYIQLSALTALLAGDSIPANVIAFKLLNGVFYSSAIGFLAATLKRREPKRMLQAIWLFACNPLVLYETFGHGHNDITLAASLLASVYFLSGRRYTLGVLSLVVGALCKHVTLMVIPLALVVALSQLENWKKRGVFLAVTGASSIAVIFLAYQPLWVGRETIDLTTRMYLYTTSFPAIIHTQLRELVRATTLAQWVSTTAAVLTLLAAGLFAWRATRNSGWESYPRAALGTLLFYLLVTCAWFQQWYAVWIIGLAAVLPLEGVSFLAYLFSFTVMTKVLVFAPPLLWARPLPSVKFREFWLSVGVMSVPWLAACVLLIRNACRSIPRRA